MFCEREKPKHVQNVCLQLLMAIINDRLLKKKRIAADIYILRCTF